MAFVNEEINPRGSHKLVNPSSPVNIRLTALEELCQGLIASNKLLQNEVLLLKKRIEELEKKGPIKEPDKNNTPFPDLQFATINLTPIKL